VAAASSSTYGIVTIQEAFNDDPVTRGWGGVDNTTAPNNYGFRTTDNTGTAVNPAWGTASPGGEIGGHVNRAPNSFYGIDLGGNFDPNTMDMNVQGVINNVSSGSSTTLNLVWSQGIASANGSGGEPGAMLGISWDDGVVGSLEARGNGFGIADTGGPNRPINSTTIPFEMDWDSATSTLTFDLNGDVGTLVVGSPGDIPDLTHWGMWGRTDSSPDNGNVLWIDDIQMTVITAINVAAGWTLNNTGNYFTGTNWSGGVPNAIDATAKFASPDVSITGPGHLVYANSNVTVGTLEFNTATPFLLAGLGTLTIQSTTTGLVDVTQGSHKINLPVVVASDTTVNVASGATLRVSDPVTINSGVDVTQTGAGTVIYESTVTVVGGGNLEIDNSQYMAALTVGSGGGVTLSQSGGNRSMRVNALSLSGKLDLKDNKLVTPMSIGSHNGSNYTGVTGLIESGRNGGVWDSAAGITTSMTDATSGTGYNMIGVATGTEARGIGATDTDLWGGRTVVGTDTLVMFTFGGDANLTGNVDVDDYGQIDFNASTGGVLTGWFNGDFDYNGFQDVDDYGVIDFVINIQNQVFPTGGGIEIAAVPEPTSVSLLALGAAAMLRRRRR
jgi:hypothetical protein